MRFKKSVSLLTALMLVLSIFTPLADVFVLNASATSNNGRFYLDSEAVTSAGYYDYGYISFGAGTDCSGFMITDNDGNTNNAYNNKTYRAFCIEHAKQTPTEGSQYILNYYNVYPSAEVSSENKFNTNILKALYYGYGGIEPWSGFSNNYNTGTYPYQRNNSRVYSRTQMAGIYITSLTLSKFYSNVTDYTISSFLNYINSAKTPVYGSNYDKANCTGGAGNTDNKFNSSIVGSNVKTTTKTFKVSINGGGNTASNKANAIASFTMPTGVTGVNETTKATAGPGKILKLKDGDKYHFETSIDHATKTASDTISGKLPRIYWYRIYETNYYRQNLASLHYNEGINLKLTINWEAQASIKITKQSSVNSYSYKNGISRVKDLYKLNATYSIYDTNNKLIKDITTNNNGESDTVQLNPGTYILKEKTPPVGFIKNTKSHTFTVAARKTYSLTINNTGGLTNSVLNETPIQGSLTISKTGGNNTDDLAGAEFYVYYNPKTPISLTVSQINNKQENSINCKTTGTIIIAKFITNSSKTTATSYVSDVHRDFETILGTSMGKTQLSNLPKGYYAIVEHLSPSYNKWKADMNSGTISSIYAYDTNTEVKKFDRVNNITANFEIKASIAENHTDSIKLTKFVDYTDESFKFNDGTTKQYNPAGAIYGIYTLHNPVIDTVGWSTIKDSLYGKIYNYQKKLLTGTQIISNVNQLPIVKTSNKAIAGVGISGIDSKTLDEQIVNLYENGNDGDYVKIYGNALLSVPASGSTTLCNENTVVAIAVKVTTNSTGQTGTSKTGIYILPRLRYYDASATSNVFYPHTGKWINTSGPAGDLPSYKDSIAAGYIASQFSDIKTADFLYISNDTELSGMAFYAPVNNSAVNTGLSTINNFKTNAKNGNISMSYFFFSQDATFKISNSINENNEYIGIVNSTYSIFDASSKGKDILKFREMSVDDQQALKNNIIYAKEIKSPDCGLYDTNDELLFLTSDENGEGIFVFNAEDSAKMDPVIINISKESTLEDDENSLEGTIFEVAYYNGFYNSYETLPENPTRVWYLDTKFNIVNSIYESKLNPIYITNDPDYANMSSEFYYDTNTGLSALPAGTITIKEMKAAEGFKLNSGNVTDNNNIVYNNRTFIGQIKLDSNNELGLFSTTSAQITGTISFTNELDSLDLKVTNKPDDLQFNFNKKFVDEESTGLVENPGANISFNFTKYTESSDHKLTEVNTVKITTDSNGNFTSVGNNSVNFEPGYVYRISEIKDNNSKTHQPIEDKYYRISSKMKEITIETTDDTTGQPISETKKVLVFTVEKLIVTISDGAISVSTNNVLETIEVDTRNADTHLFEYDLGTFYDYPNPVVSTTEFDALTGMHISSAEGTVTIKDSVAYSYLNANKSYVIKGILMEKKTDGSVVPFKVDGNYVLSTSEVFLPISKGDANDDGKLNVKDITYLQNFLNTQLENDTIYQVLSNENDPNYESYVEQYGSLVEYIKTAYSNIDIDNNGVLDNHDLELLRLSVNGWNIPLYEKSRYETSGTAELTFTFDSTKLTDEKTFVVYEYVFEGNDTSNLTVNANGQVDTTNVLRDNNGTIVAHADKDDIEQTGYIPKIGTTAQDKTSGTKLIFAKNNATLIDTVAYKNLEVTGATSTTTGRYVVVGKLFDTNTNKIIKTVAKQFKPTNMNDTIDVEFTFNANNYKGHTLVVYEYVYFEPSASEDAVHVRISNNKLSSDDSTVMYTEAIDGDISVGLYRSTFNTNGTVNSWTKLEDTPLLLAKHEDKTDVGQTVYIPEITTVVGDPIANTNGTYSITDTVNYTNLLKGHDYTLVAELRDTSGNLIATPSEITNFTISGTTNALQNSGSQDVTFTFDPTNIDTSKFVVYEYLYIGKFTSRSALDATKKVAEHTDKSDPNQTFSIGVPVSIEKRDADSGKILGGAVFEIRKADGTFVESWTSVAGQAHETKLLVGDYVLIETKAPKNYTIANPINFTVTNEKTITVNGQVLTDNTVAMSDHILTSLPDAGGNGIIGFSVAGFATMLTSVILIYKKKKEE